MPQSPKTGPASTRPRGVMLVSTACILAVAAFCGGLFTGYLLSSTKSVSAPAGQAAKVPIGVQSEDSGHSPEWLAHVGQARAAVEKDPGDASAWAHLGNLYFDEGHTAEAVEAYEKSLAIRPGDPDVLTDLGTMYRALGKPEEALIRFDAAIAARSDHRNARFNRGLILALDLGRPAEGIAAWKELLVLHPDTTMGNGTPLAEAFAPLAADAAARLEQQNRNDEALAAYALALNEQPDFIPALERMADLLEHTGQNSEAAPIRLKLKELSAHAASAGDAAEHTAPAAGN